MYAVEVSDQIMIAHSFRGEVFGPAQKVHGATFVIRVAFLRRELDENGIVVDIARAHEVLKAALAPLNYRNLDELPQFKGVNTTTEFLTRYLFDRLAEAARAGKLGRDGNELSVDPRHGRGIAGGARLVRGAVVVKDGRVRGAGRPRDADRRLRLRPAHHRRAAGARLAGEVLDLGDGFPAPDAPRCAPPPVRGLPRCRRDARSWSTGWPSACCRTPRRRCGEPCAGRAGASSAGAGDRA